MRIRDSILLVCVAFFLLAAVACAEEATKTGGLTVESAYPRLASGVLTFAMLGELPQGVLLQADTVEITAADIDRIITAAAEHLQEGLKKNAFFLLEQEATWQLLLHLATKALEETGESAVGKEESTIIDDYLECVTSEPEITDEEVIRFYEENRDLFGGAELEQVRAVIHQYLLQEKRQGAIAEYLRTLGQHVEITICASWTREQSVLAKDNPVDRVRDSGKPALVFFSGAGCCGPDVMLPIVNSLQEKYAERLNVVYIEASEEQVLAARYGVRSIPTLIIYDKAGEELLRHTGYQTVDEIESKLAEIGVE